MSKQQQLSPSELLEAEKNSYRLFGFTATEFNNRITSRMIDKWATIYDSHIASTLVDPAAPPKNVKKFSRIILDSLFQRGRFQTIFNGWKDYIATKVFFIPSNVTLPKDEIYYDAEEQNDQQKLDDEQNALEERIRQLRAQIEIVENERENTKVAIQAIREYKSTKAMEC
uniref:Uncharacterized protein n=1 Tax=Panagrolaimus superbus TaxID=310955 RepID=A0A914YVJ8_9BILA